MDAGTLSRLIGNALKLCLQDNTRIGSDQRRRRNYPVIDASSSSCVITLTGCPLTEVKRMRQPIRVPPKNFAGFARFL